MIQITQLILRRGIKTLLQNVNLTLNPGYKIGLIGANGTGKSSLFALLLGKIEQDQGNISVPPHWVIAHVAQETPALESSAIDFVLAGDQELTKIEASLVHAEENNLGEEIGYLHTELQRIDGYAARSRAARLLTGLGFSNEEQARAVSSFSGGWRMRLNLAQALMCRSDLLLLDEPTNHLDLETVLWLEDWLQSYPGTLVTISHDRDFLDNLCTHVVELHAQSLTLYTGNYSQFEIQRAEKLSLQQGAFEKQQRQIQHLESFITRFKAKASKAKQAQSRVKALERLERVTPAHISSPFDFSFSKPDSLPNPLIKLDNVSAGYGDHRIFNDVTLSIEAGSRIGLLGVNGAGKSTLIKLLSNDLKAMHGEVIRAAGLNIGYFAQHQVDTLRMEESPLWHLQKIAPYVKEQELRNFLGGFNFRGDAINQPVGPMSGGEKSRLALSLIVWQKPNLLLLDEPTNHLDLEMRHALTMALQDFVGALLVVSHDRSILESTTDEFYLIANQDVTPFSGDLNDYRLWRIEELAKQNQSSLKVQQQQTDKKTRKEEAQNRQALSKQLRNLQQKLKKIDAHIAKLQAEKATIDAFLNSSDVYLAENKLKTEQAFAQQTTLSNELGEQEILWLEIHETIEAFNVS